MEDRVYSANIQSVNKALKLLKARQASQAAKKHKKVANVDERIVYHCSSSKLHNNHVRKRQTVASSGYFRALIPMEMRKCLMRHDWAHVAELLPLLLEGRFETEPLIWRYLLIALLYSPAGTSKKFNHFIKMCVATESLNFLQKILTLPTKAEDDSE